LTTTDKRPETILSDECRDVVANAVRHILNAVGEDTQRNGLVSTPDRVARMYEELLEGYLVDPEQLLNGALFDVEYDQMVVVKDIEFYSLCEHHMLPFFGYAHVGYLPDEKVVGLSKIPRLVEMFAKRFQVQERMTQQVAEFLDDLVAPRGVGVVIEATHLCAVMRGVKKHHSKMVTSAMQGEFKSNLTTRDEFMAHIRHQAGNLL
jgi:GTP cyclohydrolase IA